MAVGSLLLTVSVALAARTRYIYKCPRAECRNPTLNNEPCRAITVPVMDGVRGDEHEVLGEGHPDGRGTLTADNAARKAMFDVLDQAGTFRNKYALNFGAWLQGYPRHILWYDTATGLMTRRGWRGHCFDLPSHLTALRDFLQSENRTDVKLHGELLTSRTVVRYLEKLRVPRGLDLLKVDIDSYDCDLAEAILSAGYRPTIVQIEISPHWPPGVRATMRPGGRNVMSSGCSCAAAVELGRRFGYRLITAFGIDVTMIHESDYARIQNKVKLHTPAYCSPECGMGYCREGGTVCNTNASRWLRWVDSGENRWDEMVRGATVQYARRGWVGETSSDFGSLRMKVEPGGRITESRGPIDYRLKGNYAEPTDGVYKP
eukprot:TRINITY_DN13082_c0_g1_i1.p1 TRINITY_DN13082_c0_g1~~TRINITY_DN13082_c0_g1_i1.p1  ORF type:complete len:396 (+),score=125.77 TRINITY_DN13082_c0_g1_i1:69-1190(+)